MRRIRAIIASLRGAPRVRPEALPNEGRAPALPGLTWLDGIDRPSALPTGQVTLVAFWTHSCVNAVRAMRALGVWHERYGGTVGGLSVIGIHTPEFPFEKEADGVREAVERLGVRFPVATDNDYAAWNAWKNRYWPTLYFIDAKGDLRHRQVGESGYALAEAVIRALLAEAGHAPAAAAEPPTEPHDMRGVTPETYLGFERSEYLGSPETVRNGVAQRYSAPRAVSLGIYYLEGAWEVGDGYAIPAEPGAALTYRVTASSGHAVMEGPLAGSRVNVTVDGRTTELAVTGGRLYDLFAFEGAPAERLLRLEFPEPGVKCHALTFA